MEDALPFLCFPDAGKLLTPALPSHILSRQALGFLRASLSPDNGPFVEQLTIL